jgi:hypothetical protein
MQSGSACNVDIVNENLMHLKYDNVAKPAPPFVPQCVNMGRLVNGRANAITAGTGLKPRILASTVNMVGNNQSGDYLKKFVLSSDFDIPKDAPANKRSCVVLVNGSIGDPTTDATKWDYACQRRLRGSLPQKNIAQFNLLMDFSSSLTYDYYGNSVTVIGNPTLLNGKYVGDGSGDGLKVNSITTLGQDKWTIEGRFKFNTNNTRYDLIFSKAQNPLALLRGTDNKLHLGLATVAASSYDIADPSVGGLGTKSNYDTSSEYHIAVEFDGSTYKVYVDGVVDITVTSSTRIASNIIALVFGVLGYDETYYSLAGTMRDLRVTIGYNRYGAPFTPPPAGSLVKDNIVTDYIPTNLLSDFSNNTAMDKYNNSIQIIGNPTFSGGKYVGDGNGDGLKVTTINTLGLDKWCIEGRFKFNTNNTLYTLIGCNNVLSVTLRRTTANKLELMLSSNNSSWDIANSVLGTKNNFDTSSEYHIVVEFDGSTYKVYIDGVLDITAVSSTKVYSAFAGLVFGIYNDITNYSLAGTIDDIRITIGNIRYGSPSNATVGAQYFTPPTSGSLVPDQYWEDTNTGKIYYGSPSDWTEVEAVFLGEVTTNSNAVIDAQTYAYNRYFNSGNLSFTTSLQTINHNLGIQNLDKIQRISQIIEKSTGRAFNPYGYTNPISYDSMSLYYMTSTLSNAIGIGIKSNASVDYLDSNTGYIKVILKSD